MEARRRLTPRYHPHVCGNTARAFGLQRCLCLFQRIVKGFERGEGKFWLDSQRSTRLICSRLRILALLAVTCRADSLALPDRAMSTPVFIDAASRLSVRQTLMFHSLDCIHHESTRGSVTHLV